MFRKFILLVLILILTLDLTAQVPQALNYQAIARNLDGTIIPGQNIGVRFSVLDGSISGTVLYQETYQTTTNNFGLFTLAIGKGTPVTGVFASIDWGTVTDKFLKVEIAPQGGGNYQIQGGTQFLSVPYALYAEKTKLVGGNGISITNGNTISANYLAGVGINITGTTISGNYSAGTGITINGNTIAGNYQPGVGINITGNTISGNYSAGTGILINGNTITGNYQPGVGITIAGNTISGNYQAGPGISITGNTISSTVVSNSWLLTGNAGTTAANFLGTTDNQAFYLRTNNTNRLMIDAGQPVTGGSMFTAFLSDFASIRTAPAQFAVYGKDVSGVGIPVFLFNSVEGMTWSATGGLNNTLGRFLRMTQMINGTYSNGSFFDFGIDQGISLYISNRGQNSIGGVLPKKMITISPQDFVGVNFNWGETPTANFHTKGTLRFEGVNTNNALTRVVVMDANGNVSSRDASTFSGASYVAGVGINITGNTISGNYQAGPGITITGNTISSTATSNSWLLTGNAGTTAANFLGTTDNQPLYLRTNNTNRLMIDAGQPVTGGSMSTAFLSDFANIRTTPAQFAVYGKDVSGVGMPVHLFSSVEGMTWSATGGLNNTVGRFLRMTQMINGTYSNGSYFDFGVDQGISFYISNRGQNSIGGVLPKKMITVSPQDFVGVNFNWGETPTANFHTKGTLRFEGVNVNNTLTRVLVMDANGNVSSRDAATLGSGFWVADANGIHNNNSTGHVGIGGSSSNLYALNVEMMDNSIDGRPMARFATNDAWQTSLWMVNTTNNASFNLVVGGTGNIQPTYGVGAGGFAIVNESNASTFPLMITPDNKVGISNSQGGSNNAPRSRLHVRDGDIYIDQVGAGVIMKSPNGNCWRMTVSDAGTPVFTSIPCP